MRLVLIGSVLAALLFAPSASGGDRLVRVHPLPGAEETALAVLGVRRSEVRLSVRQALSGTFVRVRRHLADGRALVGGEAVVHLSPCGAIDVHGALGDAPYAVLEGDLDLRGAERVARTEVSRLRGLTTLSLVGMERIVMATTSSTAHAGYRVLLRSAEPPRLYEVDIDAPYARGTVRDRVHDDRSTDPLVFASGSLEDDVARHARAQGLVESIAPGFGRGEGAVIGEAFAYLYAVSLRDGVDECFGRDAGARGCVSRREGHFPEHRAGEPHRDGALLAGALWQAQIDASLSPSEGLRLAIEAMHASSDGTTVRDWIQAYLEADTILFQGAHRASLERSLTWSGLLDRSESTDALGGPLGSIPVSASSLGPTPENSDTITRLTRPGARAVRVHFRVLELESHPSCPSTHCDHVYLYDGERTLRAVLSGHREPFDAVLIPGDTVLVRFVTDAGGAPSTFEIDRLDFAE